MPIPKLRFKNDLGQDYPEWEYPKLSDIFEYITDKKHPMDEVLTIKQGIGTVPRKESGIDIKYDPKSLSNYKQVQKDDFIIHLRSFQAGFEIANTKGIVSPAYTILRKKTTIAIPFYRAYFRTNSFINHNLNIVVEGIRDGRTIDITDLKNRPIPYPILPEQQKIANFLTSYDHMIDTQTKRVEAMKTRKKGLLQKIFSQEIRFKDDHGQDFPEWKSKKLGESTYIERGGSPRPISKYITGDSNGINWIKIGDAPVEGNVITSVKEKIISEGVPKSRKVFKGDLILSNSMSYGRPYLLAVDGCIHDGWLLIRNDKNIFDIRFLMQELASQYVKAQYDRLSNQGVVSNLNKELVKSVFIKIPSLPEQRKIADFLTTVDTQIEVEEKRLETMKTIKKGLLQQMFI